MRSLALVFALAAAMLGATSAAAQTTVGSPAIDRQLLDTQTGITCIYRGPTQPIFGPGRVGTWTFFDPTPNGVITPLLFEKTGVTAWTIVGVGTSRFSDGSGAQTFDFATLVGTRTLEHGREYTIGFTNRNFMLDANGSLVAGGVSPGVAEFDGYGLTSDLWSYALATVNLGAVLGTGGAVLDASQFFSGRIYSMNAEIERIAVIDGCAGNPADLSCNVGELSPGTSFQLSVASPNFADGWYQLYYGVPSLSLQSCGTLLPGLGEVFLQFGTQALLGSGPYFGGAALVASTVPANPSLAGIQIMFQGVAIGVFAPGFPIEPTNGLWAGIRP